MNVYVIKPEDTDKYAKGMRMCLSKYPSCTARVRNVYYYDDEQRKTMYILRLRPMCGVRFVDAKGSNGTRVAFMDQAQAKRFVDVFNKCKPKGKEVAS